MEKWKQTGQGESLHRYQLPLLSSLHVLDMADGWIELIADGDFDGFVYSAWAEPDGFGGAELAWTRYPAELVVEAQPVAADYADSAE